MIIFEFFNIKDANETHEFVRERVLVPSNKMNLSNFTNIYNNHDA